MSQETNKLTDEQVNEIVTQLDKEIEGGILEELSKMPSNQGKEERKFEERMSTKGEPKQMDVMVNPETGENVIVGKSSKEKTFDEMIKRLNSDIDMEESNNKPVDAKEIIDYLANEDNDSLLLKEIVNNTDLSTESIHQLIKIINRRMKKEEFNIYRELPEELKTLINQYIGIGSNNGPQNNQIRNMTCETVIDDFIANINFNRLRNNFSKEMEDLFAKGNEEIASEIAGYTIERSKRYREYAEGLDDKEKKQRILETLDRIDDAYTLDELKEYAKKCKIKKHYLDKPEKQWAGFLVKYNDSNYNIYDLKLCQPILYRNLNNDKNDPYTMDDVNAFLVCFARYCMNMTPEKRLDHAFMYYTVYNIIFIDMNKGKTKNISDVFLQNVKDVIHNLRERNSSRLIQK